MLGFPLTAVDPAMFRRTNSLESLKLRRRPPLVENPKQLAAQFACAVTEPSPSPTDWVARNGEQTIFRTLQKMLPEVCCAFRLRLYGICVEIDSANENVRPTLLSVCTTGMPTRGWTAQD